MPSSDNSMIKSRPGQTSHRPGQAQRGLSMVELMISLVIGLLITAAVGTVFVSGGKNYRDNDRFARMQETGRFAIDMLANDISMSSFWGRLLVYPNITSTLVPLTSCNVKHVPQGSFITQNSASSAVASPYCIDTTTFLAGTGIVAVKYVNAIPFAGTEAVGGAYLRTGGNSGTLFLYNGTLPGPTETDWGYVARVYYIRNTPDPNNGSRTIPVLARKYLVGADMNNDETLLDGVEDLQVEIGFNATPGFLAGTPSLLTGNADTTPNYYRSNPPLADMPFAVTAKIYVLVRSPEPDLAPINKTYRLGSKSVPKSDNYRRKVFTTTVVLRNANYQLRANDLNNLILTY